MTIADLPVSDLAKQLFRLHLGDYDPATGRGMNSGAKSIPGVSQVEIRTAYKELVKAGLLGPGQQTQTGNAIVPSYELTADCRKKYKPLIVPGLTK